MADVDSRAGTRYATPALLAYLDRLHAPHDPALARAYALPHAEGMPQIQVGPSEGKLIQLLLSLVRPRRAVEVGTLAGYSALRIERALAPHGKLWTLESDPKHHRVATRAIAEAGLSGRVECLLGDALASLEALAGEGPFDAIFIDADKARYDAYGRWAAANLRPGGMLLGDNAYLFGRLLDDGEEAQAMRRFHEQAAAAFDTVCIPTPDGLLLGLKR